MFSTSVNFNNLKNILNWTQILKNEQWEISIYDSTFILNLKDSKCINKPKTVYILISIKPL